MKRDENMENQKPAAAPDKKWLLEVLTRRGLTQNKLAKEMEVDPATISYLMGGTRALKLNELTLLSAILQVPAAEIMHRWGYPVKYDIPHVKLRFYLRDDCSLSTAIEPFVDLPAPPGLTFDGLAVQVRTASGAGTLWNGMICFIPGGHYTPAEALGHLAKIETEEGQTFMGVLSRGYEKDRYNVTHPAYSYQVEDLSIVSATPVAWYRPA
jgi:transcriptional regulator with XRE-family HTH domain